MAAVMSQLLPTCNMIRYCFFLLVFGFILRGDNEFTIPLDDGSGIAQGIVVAVKLVARSKSEVEWTNCSTAWCIGYEVRRFGRLDILERPLTIKLQFDQGGLCKGVPSQWSESAEEVISGIGSKRGGFHLEDAEGCTIDVLEAALVSAKIGTKPLVEKELLAPDFTDQLKAIQIKRDAETARRRKAAEERKQRDSKEAARAAKLKAEEDARAAEERRKVRVACAAIYQATIDKKVKDLTVREEQQVRGCQMLNLYPPN
jgi:hypothetical protein